MIKKVRIYLSKCDLPKVQAEFDDVCAGFLSKYVKLDYRPCIAGNLVDMFDEYQLGYVLFESDDHKVIEGFTVPDITVEDTFYPVTKEEVLSALEVWIAGMPKCKRVSMDYSHYVTEVQHTSNNFFIVVDYE